MTLSEQESSTERQHHIPFFIHSKLPSIGCQPWVNKALVKVVSGWYELEHYKERKMSESPTMTGFVKQTVTLHNMKGVFNSLYHYGSILYN